MKESEPDNYVVVKDANGDVSPTMAAIELGISKGYKKYESRLQLLAKPVQKLENLVGEPTYSER